ncbi:MAG: hypothetical protein IKT68_05820, partial [Clostridia bacterium]|nr:hypothetical protein [Clostridia bacterium]
MFCEKCGAQMSEEQTVCATCGWTVPSDQPVQPQEVGQATPDAEGQPIPQYMPVEEVAPAKKKTWLKIVIPIVAIVVAAMVALAIFQPFGSDKDVIGKWQGDVDLTKAYNEMLANEGVEGVQFHDMRI